MFFDVVIKVLNFIVTLVFKNALICRINLYVLVALRFSQRTISLRLQLATSLPCVAAPAAEDS